MWSWVAGLGLELGGRMPPNWKIRPPGTKWTLYCYFTVLKYCTALHCIVLLLHCTALHILLYCTVLHYIALYMLIFCTALIFPWYFTKLHFTRMDITLH